MRIARLAVGMPAAATITFFLFLGMMTLITVEYRQEAPIPDYDLDIFPTVEPIDDSVRNADFDAVQPVEPPPPPPRINVANAAVDAAPASVDLGGLPDLGGVELTQTSFTMPDNREETPIVRIPPEYPPTLLARDVEGSCLVTYDIAANGHPFNVAANCTNAGFVRAAERSVQGWRFNPRREGGENVVRSGRQTTVTFEIDA